MWKIENGEEKKYNCYWDRSKSFSASENLWWALILDLYHKQPKSHFPRRVTWQGDFFSLGRDSQLHTVTDLILVDTSWHWVDTVLLCIIVYYLCIIVYYLWIIVYYLCDFEGLSNTLQFESHWQGFYFAWNGLWIAYACTGTGVMHWKPTVTLSCRHCNWWTWSLRHK